MKDKAFETWMEMVGEIDKEQKNALFAILDEIQSQTCDNCSNGTPLYKGHYCGLIGNVPQDFGCIRFTRK